MRFGALLLLLSAISCTAPPADNGTSSAPTPPPAAPSSPAASAPCVPAANRLCPVDEASHDPSFAAFRERLLEAVRSRDAQALLAAVDPSIRTGFGPGGGIDDFRAQWKLDSSASPLWDELGRILELGGTFRGEGDSRSFWAPYVYSAWPEGKDSFTHVAAIRSGVPIRETATSSAGVVTTVDWEILELMMGEGWRPDAPWLEVRLADGRTGWVSGADVRSPSGWRAGFMKRDGEWRMNALVAGD